MAEIVNLRRARKDKARAEKSRAAETNRALHGRTSAERIGDAEEKARAAKLLHQAKRER